MAIAIAAGVTYLIVGVAEEAMEVENELKTRIREALEGLETYRSKEVLFESLAKLVATRKRVLRTTTNR